eukprot:2765394-Pyramimonas_sp.AAC.1
MLCCLRCSDCVVPPAPCRAHWTNRAVEARASHRACLATGRQVVGGGAHRVFSRIVQVTPRGAQVLPRPLRRSPPPESMPASPRARKALLPLPGRSPPPSQRETANVQRPGTGARMRSERRGRGH